jgi:hypothetical protein
MSAEGKSLLPRHRRDRIHGRRPASIGVIGCGGFGLFAFQQFIHVAGVRLVGRGQETEDSTPTDSLSCGASLASKRSGPCRIVAATLVSFFFKGSSTEDEMALENQQPIVSAPLLEEPCRQLLMRLGAAWDDEVGFPEVHCDWGANLRPSIAAKRIASSSS